MLRTTFYGKVNDRKQIHEMENNRIYQDALANGEDFDILIISEEDKKIYLKNKALLASMGPYGGFIRETIEYWKERFSDYTVEINDEAFLETAF